jgi:hypothetical protein
MLASPELTSWTQDAESRHSAQMKGIRLFIVRDRHCESNSSTASIWLGTAEVYPNRSLAILLGQISRDSGVRLAALKSAAAHA